MEAHSYCYTQEGSISNSTNLLLVCVHMQMLKDIEEQGRSTSCSLLAHKWDMHTEQCGFVCVDELRLLTFQSMLITFIFQLHLQYAYSRCL